MKKTKRLCRETSLASTGGGLFLAALFGFFAAQFPDDAARAEFAINAGIGASLA